MSGKILREILERGGYSITSVAKLMGTNHQSLSQILNKTSDVKTGTIEKLCEVLNVDMTFFYGGTDYLPDTPLKETESAGDLYKAHVSLLDRLSKAIEEKGELKVQIAELKKQISSLERELGLNKKDVAS